MGWFEHRLIEAFVLSYLRINSASVMILIVLFIRTSVSILKVSIRQLKAARALLGWSQQDLALAAGVSEPTVKRLEAAEGPLGGREDTTQKLLNALQREGIEFIAENGGGAGVRLRNRKTK